MTIQRHSRTPPPNKQSPYLAFKDDRYRLIALVARDIKNMGIAAMVVFGPIATLKIPGLLWLLGLK